MRPQRDALTQRAFRQARRCSQITILSVEESAECIESCTCCDLACTRGRAICCWRKDENKNMTPYLMPERRHGRKRCSAVHLGSVDMLAPVGAHVSDLLILFGHELVCILVCSKFELQKATWCLVRSCQHTRSMGLSKQPHLDINI